MPNVAMNGLHSNAKYVTAEEGGTQVIITGNGGTGRRRSLFTWMDSWSRLELVLTIMCIFLALVVITLIVIIAAKPPYHVSPGLSSATDKELNKPGGGNTSYLISMGKGSAKDICLTSGCVNAASRLISAMDTSVEPCDNFFDYACGNWNKMNVIPEDRSSHTTFSKLGDDIQAMLKNLLEKPIEASKDIQSTIKAKNLYASCLNETQIDRQGLEPIRRLIADLGGWPILEGRSWGQERRMSIRDLIVKLCLYNNKILINQWVSADDKNSMANIIQLDQPELGMPARDYFLSPDLIHKIPVYKKYIKDVALMFGANHDVATDDVEDLIAFEIQLANITIPSEQRRDNEVMYNKMSVKHLSQKVPEFDWLTYLQQVYSEVNINIDETEEIVVYAPDYFVKLGKLLRTVEKRTIVNYLVWRIMNNRVNNLPRQYRNIKDDFHKSMFGYESHSARWFECVSFVNENMGNAVGRLFVEEHFDETSRETALEMIHDIRDAFYELLDEADWMDAPTRIVAKEKADAISEKIGYPDSILNNTALSEEYQNVDYHPDRYFDNVIANLKELAKTTFRKLRKPVDRTTWSTTPAVVNAFYSSTKNQIMFPAAILQPPFYSKDYPKSLNYGGIGMVIGHEITHGFDDRGRQYDKNGILVQWWDDVVIKRFKERAQCIIDQYGNFTVPEVGMKVNGIQTQGENIADNGGLKEAYRAYRKWVDHHSHVEKRLPGMVHYTDDQLFFINFAQVWCGVMRPEAAINRIKTGVHSPGRFRVIGTLQNNAAFSKAFQCPKHSYMSRKHKCTVW